MPRSIDRRVTRPDGGVKPHPTEPAVMMAMARWLIDQGARDRTFVDEFEPLTEGKR